ncbi:MAG: hypothetical protein PR2021_3560 [Candidatus Phytoplasma pruni]|uniref:Panacea domain-containing protein n=1 Tax=Poinsettia branch-inducing phytoplasma TaxID=138647 RepID=UPI0003711D84|nr:type II toxin-antitoxin system antitoxin SocA domain-containing protein [Poinsettia branch-inducing phytoplasma]WEK82424.1 MAG: hypothetical protein PR2021_3560 [Candidatus Phytoplasma pruni]
MITSFSRHLNLLLFKFYLNRKTTLFTYYLLFQAWRFGPVFPDLYKILKKYRDQIIKNVPNVTETPLTSKQIKIIDYVVSKYSRYDTWDLIDKIHSEAPWCDTFPAEKLFSRRTISDEKILKYYSQNPI